MKSCNTECRLTPPKQHLHIIKHTIGITLSHSYYNTERAQPPANLQQCRTAQS